MAVEYSDHKNNGMRNHVIPFGRIVWTVATDGEGDTAKGKLHRTMIDVAHSFNGTVLAYAHGSGLRPGDLVVVSPLASPVEGISVEIREAR